MTENSDLLADIKDNVGAWYAYWRQNNTNGRNDRLFLFGEQWTADEKEQNRRLGKADLQFNLLYPLYKSQVAEQRKNTANFKVRALGDATAISQEEVDLREDLLRAICYDQKNDIVWQKTFESQLQFGYGAIRVSTDYESSSTFNQKVLLEYFDNAEMCFWDPAAKLTDKSDGEYCGCYYDYSIEEFKRKFPNHHDMHFSQTLGFAFEGEAFIWGDDKVIRVVEYFYKKHKERTLYLLEGDEGKSLFKEDYDELKEKLIRLAVAQGMEAELPQLLSRLKIKSKRKVDDVTVMRVVATRDAIVEEETEFPSKYLPIVYIDGDSYFDKGIQYTQTFIKHAKDPQRLANYLAIEIANAIKTRRRERYIGTPSNVKGNEDQWRNPELEMGMLIANYDERGGLPQPVNTGDIPQTLLLHYQAAQQEIQRMLGIYEAFQGQESNERSGRAINARARQSSNSTFIYFDNLSRGIEQVGRIILDIMPKIYDTTRRVNLRDGNNNQREVTLNEPNYLTGRYNNEIKQGEWDLEVTAGANFEVQKQEALQTLLGIAQVNPQVFPLIADIVGSNIDIKNQGQLIERLQNIVPPEILAKERGEQPKPPQPSPQEMLMQKELELQARQIEAKMKEVETKEFEAEVKQIEALTKLQELPLKAHEANQKAEAENFRTAAELQKTIASARADVMKHAAMLTKHMGTASQPKPGTQQQGS